jgi:AAA family ATP:ADP antiporter
VEDFGRARLLLACILPLGLVTFIAFWVQRLVVKRPEDDGKPAASKETASAAWEGAKLVFRSKYLVAIAGIIACYELVSNVVDFQLASTVENTIKAPLEKDAFFGYVGQIIGIGSIGVQFLMTGWVMQRFGIRLALLFLPVALLGGSVGFLLLPSLFFAAAMSVSDNALNYSINQSAKEALYVPTSKDVTYKAKAFIDMFVQRFGKMLSVFLNLVLVATVVEEVRWLSLITLAMSAIWLMSVRYVSKTYRRMTEGRKSPERA